MRSVDCSPMLCQSQRVWNTSSNKTCLILSPWISVILVDLRTRHLCFWEPFSSTPERAQWQIIDLPPVVCSNYKQGLGYAFSLHLPIYMYLSSIMSFTAHSVAQFRPCVHTLCFETAAWNHRLSPDLIINANNDTQDE